MQVYFDQKITSQINMSSQTGSRSYYDRKWVGGGYSIDKRLVAKIFRQDFKCLSGYHLDIGCGDGSLIAYIHETNLVGGCSSVGIDFSLAGLKHARSPFSLCSGDACFLPFKDETFNLITCKETLEHMPNHISALREMRRVCRKQGTIIIVVPNFIRLVNRLSMIRGVYPDAEEHLHSFTFSRLKRDLESSDIKVKKLYGDFVCIPYTRFNHLPLAKRFPNLSSHIIAICGK